jgi:hypothetical protein
MIESFFAASFKVYKDREAQNLLENSGEIAGDEFPHIYLEEY